MGRPEGPWRTVPPGEQLLPHCHPLSVTSAGVVLPFGLGRDSVSEKCVCLGSVSMHMYVNVCEIMCEYRGHLQLPNLSGQAWASIGKSSRCMGHSALTVSLERFTETWTEN